MATAHLLLCVVAKFRWTDVGKLLERIQQVGMRLTEAQPREMVVGNIVRRVLGMIRDEVKEDRTEDFSDSASNSQIGSPKREQSTDISALKADGVPTFSPLRFESKSGAESPTSAEGTDDDAFGTKSQTTRPPLLTSHTSYAVLNGVPVQQSMFNLFSAQPSPTSTPPGTASPHAKSAVNAASLAQRIATSSQDLKKEVISGIEEIIDELEQVDDQIAGFAQETIHAGETILTHSSSLSM
jgi:translation initiation factor eIF-2B subunit beta